MSRSFQRLTRPAIRAMKPGEKINEHGITAERQATGDVRYSINIMVDGERVHRVVGRESDGVTRKQAEDAIESLRTRAREGRLDLPKGRKNHRSFAEAADDYITNLEKIGGKHIHEKRRHLASHLKPYFGKLRADKITDFGVKHYGRERKSAGVTQATVNRELATLSHMMNSIADWGWIKKDAKPKIEKGEEPRKAITVMTHAQTDALMKAAIGDQDGRTWLFVACGLNTAMRHSEILRIRYDQIDFDTLRLFIPLAKAGEREQPITPTLADILARQQKMEDDPLGWVFPAPARSKYEHRMTMRRQFERSVVRAKLDPKKVTPHVMRHTAITRLVKAGTDLPTIQRISGHKTLSMVLRYVHIHGQHIDSAIAALDTGKPDAVTPELHTAEDRTAERGAA